MVYSIGKIVSSCPELGSDISAELVRFESPAVHRLAERAGRPARPGTTITRIETRIELAIRIETRIETRIVELSRLGS